MREGQTQIFYIAGDNLDQLKVSPFVEKLKKKGYEVIYMYDAIDEYMTQQLKEYDGKKIVDCSKENLDIQETDEEKKEFEEKKEKYKDFC